MMRWLLLSSVVLLAGCAVGKLFDGEAADKEHASLLVAEDLDIALVRPLHADQSTEMRIPRDGTWVASGSYEVRYACAIPNGVVPNNPEPNREQTIHVDPGYRFGIRCNKDDSIYLENIGEHYVDYNSYGEAGYAVAQEVRGLGNMTAGSYFRYEYFNDWGSTGDIEFSIFTDNRTHLLTAHLDQYRGSVFTEAGNAYIGGVRTRDAMQKAIAPKTFETDINSCPKLNELFERLKGEFKERLDNPKAGPEMIYTDSPDVYRYYMGHGPDGMVSLYLMEDQGPLYQTTLDAMNYVKTCGKETDSQ